jgi:hypothetical protein
MPNPWLTLPFQAVRLGWETQSIVAEQMMRFAGLGISDRKAAGNFIPEDTPLPVGQPPEAPTSSVDATSVDATPPAKSVKPRQLAEKVQTIRKKRGVGTNRRRSK